MTHEEREHAELGGSTADRWLNCTASVSLCKDIPKPPPSEAMLDGTAKHEAVEKMLGEFLEHKITGVDAFSRLKDEDLREVAEEAVAEVWEHVFEESITGKAFGQEDQFAIDKKLGMYGYLDLWVIYVGDRAKRIGRVHDHKFGYHEVDVEDNAQLAFYAVALREGVREAGKDLDEVIASIYQPKSDEPFKEVRFTESQLDSWKKKFLKAAEAIFVTKKTSFKVGKWCKYCAGKGYCKAFLAQAEKTSALSLVNVSKAKLPTVETLTDEQVAKIIFAKDDLEALIDGCMSRALAAWHNGKPIPGTKCVETKPRRSWIDDEDQIIKDISEAGVECVETKLKAFTKVEKELISKVGKEEAAKLISPLLTKPAPGLKLVHESDKKPAAKRPVDLITAIEE